VTGTAPSPPSCVRRFVLHRVMDVSGVSGVGRVAEGVEWSDGTVSLHWPGQHASITFWHGGILAVESVHGHGGATRVLYLDPAPDARPGPPARRNDHRDVGSSRPPIRRSVRGHPRPAPVPPLQAGGRPCRRLAPRPLRRRPHSRDGPLPSRDIPGPPHQQLREGTLKQASCDPPEAIVTLTPPSATNTLGGTTLRYTPYFAALVVVAAFVVRPTEPATNQRRVLLGDMREDALTDQRGLARSASNLLAFADQEENALGTVLWSH
jgi:hypothetical protein